MGSLSARHWDKFPRCAGRLEAQRTGSPGSPSLCMPTSSGFEKQTMGKTMTQIFFLKYEFLFVLIGARESG